MYSRNLFAQSYQLAPPSPPRPPPPAPPLGDSSQPTNCASSIGLKGSHSMELIHKAPTSIGPASEAAPGLNERCALFLPGELLTPHSSKQMCLDASSQYTLMYGGRVNYRGTEVPRPCGCHSGPRSIQGQS